jgi:hypothetical protein
MNSQGMEKAGKELLTTASGALMRACPFSAVGEGVRSSPIWLDPRLRRPWRSTTPQSSVLVPLRQSVSGSPLSLRVPGWVAFIDRIKSFGPPRQISRDGAGGAANPETLRLAACVPALCLILRAKGHARSRVDEKAPGTGSRARVVCVHGGKSGAAAGLLAGSECFPAGKQRVENDSPLPCVRCSRGSPGRFSSRHRHRLAGA